MHAEDSLINFVFWESLALIVRCDVLAKSSRPDGTGGAMLCNVLAVLASGDTWLFVVKAAQLLSKKKDGLCVASLPLKHDGLPWI